MQFLRKLSIDSNLCKGHASGNSQNEAALKGDLQTICRFSYMKVYKLITLGTKFKNLHVIRRKNYNVFKIHNELH